MVSHILLRNIRVPLKLLLFEIFSLGRFRVGWLGLTTGKTL